MVFKIFKTEKPLIQWSSPLCDKTKESGLLRLKLSFGTLENLAVQILPPLFIGLSKEPGFEGLKV